MFDLTGRVAVVTGGNRGIGLGLSRGLARAGARLAIWSRDADRNAEAVSELEGMGAEAWSGVCDVSEEADIVRATAETLERFGRIDSCFANAGTGRLQKTLEMTLAQWKRLLSVNLDGVFLTFREVAKHMVERGGGGKLVAITSIGEIYGMPRQAHYAASKGALGALVRSLAVEFGRHDIQVNGVQPGWIETEATEPLLGWKAMNETIVHRTPAGRWGTPEDLEGVAVYLASDASRFHTGDTLRVDGGYSVF